jgi:hypothetical protein
MSVLTQASRQWMSRPADERFTSLEDMLAHFRHQRSISRAENVSTGILEARPVKDDEERKSLVLMGADDERPAFATHWSFGQLCQLVKAPAGYLRTLPADIAADNLNYGIVQRRNDEVGTLVRRNGLSELAAATGPQYGRVWNDDVVAALVQQFGDGITGDFTVPGEFGKAVDVTKANTTLYASDRDMFVFLADEKNRIELPNRRNGKSGELARGFFVWNSEVGSTSLGIGTFLFDFVCFNRMVWGAEGYQEIRIRHSSGAPGRWLGEVMPAIKAYQEKSASSIVEGIELARSKKIGDKEAVQDFLAKRFSKTQAEAISLAHFTEEDRPIESLWDAAVGITAYARRVEYQDARVGMEREAGKIMALAR